jgi:membrane-anchored glycerophosphoryl diester phosphodiesterase (GDPDase)
VNNSPLNFYVLFPIVNNLTPIQYDSDCNNNATCNLEERDMAIEGQKSPDSSQDFSVGASGLVSRTFSLWLRRLGSYIVIVGIVGAILSLFNAVVAVIVVPVNPEGFLNLISTSPIDIIFKSINWTTTSSILVFGVVIALSLLGMIVNSITQGAAIRLCLEDYGNRGAGTIKESFSYAGSRLVTLIGAQLLYGIILMIPVMPGGIVFAYSTLTVDWMDPSTYGAILASVPLLLVGIIITLYLAVRLAPTIAVVIAEKDKSAVASVKRAWKITGHHFWHIFGGLILLIIVIVVVSIIIGILVAPIALVAIGLVGLAGIIISIFISPFPAIFQAVLYRDLESRARITQADWW